MGHVPPPTTPLLPALSDVVHVYTARSALAPVLARLQQAPLDPAAAAGMREWLEIAYPPAAEALHRLQSISPKQGASSAHPDPGPGDREGGAEVAPAPTTHHPVRAQALLAHPIATGGEVATSVGAVAHPAPGAHPLPAPPLTCSLTASPTGPPAQVATAHRSPTQPVNGHPLTEASRAEVTS